MKKIMLKKISALILVALMLVGSFAGCGDVVDDTPSVYWLNLKPEASTTIQKLASMYKEKTGVNVDTYTAASGSYTDLLASQMDSDNAPTIFVVGKTSFVNMWGDSCLDLKDTKLIDELSSDQYKLYDKNGKLCSIGYCYECYGIIVNTKLLKQAGYDVDYIKNFETLKTVVEDIHARSSELGFDAFTSSGMDDSSSWRFTGHLANIDYYYESLDDPDTWKTCPSSIKGTYLKNYKNLYDLMVENSATNRKTLAGGGFDAAAEFANGEAAFYLNGSWEWENLSKKGMKAEDLKMIPYYCGVLGEEDMGLNVGTENYWAINSNASAVDQQASIDFLHWIVTDPEASKIAVGTFGAMPYKHAVKADNPFMLQANEYIEANKNTMTTVTTFQPNADIYRKAIASALNDYNANPNDETWESVETAFIDGWAVNYKKENS